MLSMLVYFSSAQLAQSQAVAPPALLPLLHVTVSEHKTIFTVAGDKVVRRFSNSHVLTPIPMHFIPIPIPSPSHDWFYSHSHGNPMGPMGSQSSPFPCTPLLETSLYDYCSFEYYYAARVNSGKRKASDSFPARPAYMSRPFLHVSLCGP